MTLKARRIKRDLTQEDVQAATGEVVSQGTVSDVERGKVLLDSLTTRRLSAYAKALGWSLYELQETTGVDLGLPRDRPPVLEPDDPPGKAMSIDLMPAGCGPALESDERIGTISIPADMARGGKRLIALRAEGTSMTPELDHGDIAIAAIDDGLCQPGDLCPIYLPDEGVVIKRFVRELRDGTLLLESLNPAEGQEAVFEAPAGSRVLGKAVFVIKSL